MRHPSRHLAPACALLCSQKGCESYRPKEPDRLSAGALAGQLFTDALTKQSMRKGTFFQAGQ